MSTASMPERGERRAVCAAPAPADPNLNAAACLTGSPPACLPAWRSGCLPVLPVCRPPARSPARPAACPRTSPRQSPAAAAATHVHRRSSRLLPLPLLLPLDAAGTGRGSKCFCATGGTPTWSCWYTTALYCRTIRTTRRPCRPTCCHAGADSHADGPPHRQLLALLHNHEKRHPRAQAAQAAGAPALTQGADSAGSRLLTVPVEPS